MPDPPREWDSYPEDEWCEFCGDERPCDCDAALRQEEEDSGSLEDPDADDDFDDEQE